MKLSITFSLLVSAVLTAANVEKTIFLGPEPVPIPQQRPTLSDLNLHTLTPGNSSIRTHLDREFPGTKEETGQESRGVESWLLLSDLTEGQRYEVRVCWAAIVSLFYLWPPPNTTHDTERVSTHVLTFEGTDKFRS